MRHIDEGTLHAYLDGALEEYPTAEARRVRAHLDACAECRDRLDEEREVREAAASILGLASPRVEAPAFEDLRAYVRTHPGRPSRTSVRMYRLGWAASVAIAVGAGWMLRGGDATGRAAGVDTGSGSEVAPPVVATPEQNPIRARPDVASSPAMAEAARSALPAQTAAAPPVVEEPSLPAQALELPVEPTDLVADLVVPPIVDVPPTAAPEIVVPPADSQPVQVVVLMPDDASTDQGDDTPPRPTAPAEVVTSAQVSGPAAGLARGRTDRGDTRDEPTEDDSYSLVVPGLAVLDVRFRGTGTRPEGQVALQLLASGDTLEVIHLPPELGPGTLEPRADGTNELVVQRSAGWIVMRAPLADAELMELMTRLLAGS